MNNLFRGMKAKEVSVFGIDTERGAFGKNKGANGQHFLPGRSR